MIFDRTHRLALLYKDGEPAILRADTVELPPESPGEQRCRAMWRTFYDTVGIEAEDATMSAGERTCRKRYWRDTPELGHFGGAASGSVAGLRSAGRSFLPTGALPLEAGPGGGQKYAGADRTAPSPCGMTVRPCRRMRPGAVPGAACTVSL